MKNENIWTNIKPICLSSQRGVSPIILPQHKAFLQFTIFPILEHCTFRRPLLLMICIGGQQLLECSQFITKANVSKSIKNNPTYIKCFLLVLNNCNSELWKMFLNKLSFKLGWCKFSYLSSWDAKCEHRAYKI